MSDPKVDPELKAIEQVIAALGDLDAEARTRVVTYVFQRLGLSVPNVPSYGYTSALGSEWPSRVESEQQVRTVVTDIRTLKEVKKPKSDSEMASLVAYYLREIASPEERKDAISKDDIEQYFKQAGFPLPKSPRMTLPNAKNAGYFDQAGPGLYKLNPVGHNLVVHILPGGSGEKQRTSEKRTRTRRASRKRT